MKKAILIRAVVILTITAIGAIAYIKTRPEPMTVCESLTWAIMQAKTQAEHDYAEGRWRLVCTTNQP